jgi:hypothetical protein
MLMTAVLRHQPVAAAYGAVLIGVGLLAVRIRRVGYVAAVLRSFLAFVLLIAAADATVLLLAAGAEAMSAVLGVSAARATATKQRPRQRSKRFDEVGSAIIHFSFVGLLIVALLAEGRIGAAVGFALSWIVFSWGTLAVHEAGHALVARRSGNDVPDVAIGAGLRLFRIGRITIGAIPFLGHTHWVPNESLMTSRQELYITLGGPAANLVVACVLATIPSVRAHGLGIELICVHLGAALLNLLPFERTFHGKRIRSDGAQALRLMRAKA